MKNEYKIFTDSSSNLTNELIDKYDISIVSLLYTIEDKSYLSYQKGEDNNLKEFYEQLRLRKNVLTSCSNEETFKNEFYKAINEGYDIIYIGFSSALSSTYHSATLAVDSIKEEMPNVKIYTVDSLGASLGEGMLVIEAAKRKLEGATIEELRDWLEEKKLHINHYFTVDDLYYLYKGGRVSKFNYCIGSIVGIKPILHVNEEGKLIPLSKTIGRKKALLVLVDKTIRNISNTDTIYISHGDCIDDVNYVINKIKDKIAIKDIIINYVDSVVGAHSGPGTIAIFFFGPKRQKNQL